ncbi:MAG: type II toxin-antitoxin system HicB family antitoxin [Tepidisphaerales bacterium]
MRQVYHAIIKRQASGYFVGWVEEVPGTLTYGRTLEECRLNLRGAVKLMVETIRDEARLGLDDSCITEPLEVEVEDDAPDLARV